MPTDYHMHTTFSDGRNSHQKMVAGAIKAGLQEIGFSDHICLNNPDWSAKISDVPKMYEAISKLREESTISIKFGLEVDWLAGREKEIVKVLDGNPELDYVIGSVHYINDWIFDDDSYRFDEYQKWDIEELYKVYFNLVQKAAQSKLFDIIGHPDLIKKFNFRPKGDVSDCLKETAKVFKASGVCVDINTSGLDLPCQEIYPSRELLEFCFAEGVPITFGSDAHSFDKIASHFDEAIKFVKEVGYRKYATFSKRKIIIKKL